MLSSFIRTSNTQNIIGKIYDDLSQFHAFDLHLSIHILLFCYQMYHAAEI